MLSDNEGRAKAQKSLKRIVLAIENIDKQFDLGFISEKEFAKRRNKLIKKFALLMLADTERMLKTVKGTIRRAKLSHTRWAQRSIVALAGPDGFANIGEMEECLRENERIIADALDIRKGCEERIIKLKDMLRRVE